MVYIYLSQFNQFLIPSWGLFRSLVTPTLFSVSEKPRKVIDSKRISLVFINRSHMLVQLQSSVVVPFYCFSSFSNTSSFHLLRSSQLWRQQYRLPMLEGLQNPSVCQVWRNQNLLLQHQLRRKRMLWGLLLWRILHQWFRMKPFKESLQLMATPIQVQILLILFPRRNLIAGDLIHPYWWLNQR